MESFTESRPLVWFLFHVWLGVVEFVVVLGEVDPGGVL